MNLGNVQMGASESNPANGVERTAQEDGEPAPSDDALLRASLHALLSRMGYDVSAGAGIAVDFAPVMREAMQRTAHLFRAEYTGTPEHRTLAEREFLKILVTRSQHKDVLIAIDNTQVSDAERARVAAVVEQNLRKVRNPKGWYTPRRWFIESRISSGPIVRDLLLGLLVTCLCAQEDEVLERGMSLADAAKEFGVSD